MQSAMRWVPEHFHAPTLERMPGSWLAIRIYRLTSPPLSPRSSSSPPPAPFATAAPAPPTQVWSSLNRRDAPGGMSSGGPTAANGISPQRVGYDQIGSLRGGGEGIPAYGDPMSDYYSKAMPPYPYHYQQHAPRRGRLVSHRRVLGA